MRKEFTQKVWGYINNNKNILQIKCSFWRLKTEGGKTRTQEIIEPHLANKTNKQKQRKRARAYTRTIDTILWDAADWCIPEWRLVLTYSSESAAFSTALVVFS